MQCALVCQSTYLISLLVDAQAANAITFDALQGLTYLQVKGSGIANTCPVLEGGSSNLRDLKAGNYKLTNFCMEPTSFTVKEEGGQLKGSKPEFVKTKLMTRLTYTLGEVSTCVCIDRLQLIWKAKAFAGCASASFNSSLPECSASTGHAHTWRVDCSWQSSLQRLVSLCKLTA